MAERQAFLLELAEGALPEYRRRHDEIWPEMSELLDAAGVSDFSAFAWQDRFVIATLKAHPDFASADAVMRSSEIYAKWESSMAGLMAADVEPIMLEEIFRHDGVPATGVGHG